MERKSLFRRDAVTAILVLVFGIIGGMFLLLGGVFFGVARRVAETFQGEALPVMLPVIFLIIGGAFFVTALLLLLRSLSKEKKRRAVIERGNIVTATVTDVRRNLTVTVNGRCPYVVECSFQDGPAGETYLLKSDNLWNGRPQVEIGDTVPVFWDEYDKRHYVVDISGLAGADVVDLR